MFIRYDDDDFLEFRVEDTCRGISKDQLQHFFQPFSQADASITRKYAGTGLGLVLTKNLWRALGGDFWLVKSELGKGSTFVARIKIERTVRSIMLPGEQFRFNTSPVDIPVKDPSKLLLGLNLLLVEDSPDNQMLIKIVLTRLGATVEIAGDGEVGLNKALQNSYDVVIMDVQMPRMGGYEATLKLREAGYTKPIVALTAHAMSEERERCLAAGYSDFLSKPIDKNRMIEVLSRYQT